MINKEKINETVAVLQSAATNEELLTVALKGVDADTIITMLRNVYAYGLRTAMEGISSFRSRLSRLLPKSNIAAKPQSIHNTPCSPVSLQNSK